VSEPFYVTTPIYYVNDVPHIGHAYTTVAADVATRYHRLRGDDAYLLTGTDEHGQKVERTAQENGVDPQSWVDSMIPRWKQVWERLGISYDDFIRTTEVRHAERVARFVQQLYDQGDIYLGRYEGPYCVACEAFYLESELVDGLCPIHKRPVERVTEENYFFALSKYGDWLLHEYYARDPAPVQPAERLNEVVGFVSQGLQDISMSRAAVEWGIPIPWDPKHVIYVWIEALQNYITALGYPDGEKFGRYWPGVHLVGKDILRFHAVIWPAMLHAAGVEPPRTVFAHGWLLVGGEKMSKTKLTGIHPNELLDVFGADAYRYYFMREIAFGQDGSFSWESMVARYNADLANDFGNLASRVLAMITSYFDGLVPEPAGRADALAASAESAVHRYRAGMDAFDFAGGVGGAWEIVRAANRYVVETAPWELNKAGDKAALATALWSAAECLRLSAILLAPVMPLACERLWSQLGIGRPLASMRLTEDARWGGLDAGVKVTKGDALFPRIESA
jgi:methionyl-tRNA synthetase